MTEVITLIILRNAKKMKKITLANKNEISIYGTKKNIEEAEKYFDIDGVKNISSELQEGDIRLILQRIIDDRNIKASILYDGNTVWSKKSILKNIRTMFRNNSMELMSDYVYQFLSLSCGSIAHYNKCGWIDTYPNMDLFKNFFKCNEFGQRVLDYIPKWKTDAIEIVKEIEKILGV